MISKQWLRQTQFVRIKCPALFLDKSDCCLLLEPGFKHVVSDRRKAGRRARQNKTSEQPNVESGLAQARCEWTKCRSKKVCLALRFLTATENTQAGTVDRSATLLFCRWMDLANATSSSHCLQREPKRSNVQVRLHGLNAISHFPGC